MLVTPFGEFDLDDDVALERFLDAHDRRHQVYVPIFRIAGGTLDGPVDGDWMHRHAARHVILATLAGQQLSSADTKALLLPGKWKTQRELIDWNDLHNRLHFVIDRQAKIV